MPFLLKNFDTKTSTRMDHKIQRWHGFQTGIGMMFAIGESNMKYCFLIIAMIFFAACGENSRTEKVTATDSLQTTADTNDSSAKADEVLQASPSAETNAANSLIVAGKSIGNVGLGMNDSILETQFGKPDMSDAAMGKAWLTWYGKKPDEHNNKTQLNIYTTYKDTSMREKTVQQVRTTSSFFKTADELHVYSSLEDIKAKFPQLKKAATYKDKGREITVYDDQQQGIAFEIVTADTQNICTGIIIHKPGVKVTQVYISLHPEMRVL